MHNVEVDENPQHQHRIENIQIHLAPHQWPIVPSREFNHSKHGSNQDADAGNVQSADVLLPIDGRGCWSWRSTQSTIEDHAGDEEDAKEDDLQKEADDYNMLPEVDTTRFRHHGTTCRLHEKRQDIPEDEYLGQPLCPNRSHALPLRQQNQSAQNHVYACGE